MYCKTCARSVKKFPLRIEKISEKLYMAHCTNPNHSHSFYCSWQFINGGWFLRPQAVKPQKRESYTVGDYTHYWDGKQEQKMKTSYLKDIRSRAVTQDGTILTGDKGNKYNRERGVGKGRGMVLG